MDDDVDMDEDGDVDEDNWAEGDEEMSTNPAHTDNLEGRHDKAVHLKEWQNMKYEQPQQLGSPAVSSVSETDPLGAAEREEEAAWLQNLVEELAKGNRETGHG